MAQPLIIALDAMGGDHAPGSVVSGAALACIRHPDVRFLFFGDERRLQPLIAAEPALEKISTIRHTDMAIAMDDRPSVALRSGRESSMRLALDAVAAGEASCAVSAGNTGALMAMAKFALKTLPGVSRPAIASFLPTARGESVMLDLGANVECSAGNLVQFAVMGGVFARSVLGVRAPSIGLLNVGAEELKGNDTVREAAGLLRDAPLPGPFHGFIEGDDIAGGTVDVVVTDGFTGNVALKTAEGTARLIGRFTREAFMSSVLAKLGYLFAMPALSRLKKRTDPRRYNGGVFLGLRGIAVKSHGGTDALGFANAIGVAHDLARGDAADEIARGIAALAAPGDKMPDNDGPDSADAAVKAAGAAG